MDLLTTAEAASILKLHTKTVERWVRAGKLPAFTIGREWRINRLTLERWLKEQELKESRLWGDLLKEMAKEKDSIAVSGTSPSLASSGEQPEEE